MAVAFVQNRNFTGHAVSSLALAFTSNNAAGNLLVYFSSCFDGSPNTVTASTDSNTNTIAQAGANIDSTGNASMRCDYVASSNSGANTVTGHNSGTAGEVFIYIWEISGCATSSPVRDTGSVANSATASVSTAGSTSQSGDAVIACFHSDHATFTFTVGSGYSNLTQVSQPTDGACGCSEWKAATGSGTQTATVSGNGANTMTQFIAVFKQAASSTPSPAAFMPSGSSGPGLPHGNAVSW